AWCHKVGQSPVRCYDTFIKTLHRYWRYILNYFNQRVSSGFVEGLNNKIKTIKRRCYGISKISSLFQRIWLDLQGRQRFFVSTP
ncbi:MAG: transposase, partial [Anaerolineales bacterium]|nr:transposase [Anaerolineales bacterium]